MLLIGLILLVAVAAYTLVTRNQADGDVEARQEKFAQAYAEEDSAAGRAMLKLARGFAGARVTNPDEESPLYRSIRLRLAASGGLYGNSVEVFISTQVACMFIGLLCLVTAVFGGLSGMAGAVAVIFGIAVCAWPYSRLHEAASKRTREIDAALPEFAELLLMPLKSGSGVLSALNFTAERLEGPVAEEVRHLWDALQMSSNTDAAKAFEEAAEHLGTPEAKSFFTALSQSYLSGTPVAETIGAQAVALRKKEYERTREMIKKMPNKIAIVIGLHLIPSLFILTLFPAFTTLGNM